MIYIVKTYTNLGLQGFEISIEADSNKSLPTIEIIGLPDAAIKESKERIRATFRNVGIALPARKIILNLAPSDIKKVGTSFDLAMAVALLLLVQDGNVSFFEQIDQSLFFGELGLDGTIKRVNGILPSIISAHKQGYKHFFVPFDNIYELEYIPGISLYPIRHFSQVADYFLRGIALEAWKPQSSIDSLYQKMSVPLVDFAHIKGHFFAKRALCIAAAGLHNILMLGAPGSGKTLLSKALHGVLPPLGFQEILEVSQIYSVVGKLDKHMPLVVQRPFRQVHHTASRISIVGGGSQLTPGEVSLAHKGILFFDELTEFPREVLEVLRQPLEDRLISISRVSGTIQYPASFMFVASMNPCKCGYFKDPITPCRCSLLEVKRYQSKVSGPLLDRIDMLLEIPREPVDRLLDYSAGESSEVLRDKVVNARAIQQKRFAGTGITSNSQMTSKSLDEFVPLEPKVKDFLIQAVSKLNLSSRVVHRIIKLARTIADMEPCEKVGINHLAEALQYRNKNLFVEQ